MKKYGVLIVDDSALMRKAVGLLIEREPEFYVAGIARNGRDAIEKVERLKPDVITLDIEMPEMDGISALEVIMSKHPVPVVMLSNLTSEGAEATITSFELGAVDFFLKDKLFNHPTQEVIDDFLLRLKTAVKAKVRITSKRPEEKTQKLKEVQPLVKQQNLSKEFDLLLIGCSTGGPSALQEILPKLPGDFGAPVIVVQHMPPGFTKPLADRFNTLCALKVKEAEHGEILQAGVIYIAPAGLQTTVQKKPEGNMIKLAVFSPVETLYKPSVDVTLLSIAPLYQSKLAIVILTGMGSDGLKGCKLVKEYSGMVLTESEDSCVVYGMPKVVYEAGLSDKQVPVTEMYAKIMSLF